MVSQKRISGLHVPRTNANLTSGFAASGAAGVNGMDFSFVDSLRNDIRAKGMKNLEFDEKASGTNRYGIFHVEIPWLKDALMVYSDIQVLCSNRCANNCGVCRIRERIDILVEQYLMRNETSQKWENYNSSCRLQNSVSHSENKVESSERMLLQQESAENIQCKDDIKRSNHFNLRPRIKFCRFCGWKHRVGSPLFCRSFGKKCNICQRLNHHPTVCWFRESWAKSPRNSEPFVTGRSSLERNESKEKGKEYGRYRKFNTFRKRKHHTFILKNGNDLHRTVSSSGVSDESRDAVEKIGKTLSNSLQRVQKSCASLMLKESTEVVETAKMSEEMLCGSAQEVRSIERAHKAILNTHQIHDEEPGMEDSSEIKSREKVTFEQNSLMNPEEALTWINSKLKRNYGSFSKLKNGRGLGDLITNVLGYTVNSKLPWEDIKDILIMADMEKDVSVGKLKCNDIQEIAKFTSLLKCAEEELQSKKDHGGSSKGNCCNLKI